ncbi:hypothetical protein K3175_13655 [Qipengyuania sp. GH1]|uniref:hypothetical protein n=1 Tax=Qipengyuania aestuarii TaxID=2867241 RepID=UPI001C87A970|nr:hypothetical protein [Qipengyuania aestuarii]MBX7536707.1 hypothetical protein [Qipengyuania aestuarii]
MTDKRPADKGAFPALPLLLAWAVICAILLATGAQAMLTRSFFDPDDAMRLVQVRDLIGGQGWFDLTQYRLDPPTGTPMHWSRLVDLPIMLVIAGLTPLMGQAAAETAAFVIVPFATLGIALAAIGRLAWSLLGTRPAIFAVAVCGLITPLLFQFLPMRIDHHGWQVVSVAIALFAIGWPKGKWAARLAGAAMAFGLSVSLEILPMAAAFAGVLFLRWARGPEQRYWLIGYMQAYAATLVILYIATRGLATTPYCDAVSPAHLAFFAVATVGTMLIGQAHRQGWIALVALFAVVGAAAAASYAIISPDCLATPFARLDPMVDRYWYRLILEGQPLWKQAASLAVPAIIQLAAALGATVALWRGAKGPERGWWFDHLLILLAAIALSVMVTRSLAFAAIIAAIPLGWLVSRLLDTIREEGATGKRIGALAMLVLLLAPSSLFSAAEQLAPAAADERSKAAAINAEDKCDIYGSADRIAGLPRGTIFAPMDIGPALLLNTGHGVVATSHHRAADAMGDVIRGFLAGPPQARTYVTKHGANYVVLCAGVAESRLYARAAPDGLAARLLGGEVPAWLAPVDHDGPAELRVYRVLPQVGPQTGRQAGTKSIATPLMQ